MCRKIGFSVVVVVVVVGSRVVRLTDNPSVVRVHFMKIGGNPPFFAEGVRKIVDT
jgi:hypothetical protein